MQFNILKFVKSLFDFLVHKHFVGVPLYAPCKKSTMMKGSPFTTHTLS